MSLYNALFGTNSNADLLLAALGVARDDVPRFRDCYLDDGNIVIHTRTGGGNRDYYESEESCRIEYPEYFQDDTHPSGPWNEDLRKLPGYLKDEDDDFDSTYANFVFDAPPGIEDLLKKWGQMDNAIAPADKWQQLFNDLQSNTDSPESVKALEVGAKIFGQIDKGEQIIKV